MKIRGSMVDVWQSGLRGVQPKAYIALLLIPWLWLVPKAWGENPSSTPFRASIMSSQVDIPRQLTLEVAEQLLAQYNLAIVATRYGVDNARAQRLIASVRPNPTLTLGAEAFGLRTPGRNLFSNSDSASNRLYTVRLDQVFERGNKRSLRTETAEFQVQAAEAQVLDTIRTQLLQLRQAFYTALLARENVLVAHENLDLTNDTERLIKTRVSAGDAPEWDLIKFQASKVQFQRDLAAARLAYQQAVRDVLTFMGATFPPGSSVTPAAGAPPMSTSLLDAPLDVIGELRAAPLVVSFSLDELRQAALETRPDVQAAQCGIDAAQRNLDLAYAQRHRDIDVALEYQRNGGDNTVGATVSFPLFLSHKFEGHINQGLAQVQQASVTLDQAKLQTMADVEKAYQAYQSSRQVLQVYTTEALAKAEASFRIAGVSYRQGATSLLELQDAQRTLNQTRVAANQAFFDYRMSLFQLEQATGKSLVKP
jgi:cobalt-zinc-cadmium efflux system outer membrane protein